MSHGAQGEPNGPKGTKSEPKDDNRICCRKVTFFVVAEIGGLVNAVYEGLNVECLFWNWRGVGREKQRGRARAVCNFHARGRSYPGWIPIVRLC